MVTAQIFALVGVVLGAATSYAVTALGERSRYRRSLDAEWRERRFQTYKGYLAEVKRARMLAQRIAAGVGLDDQAEPIDRESGLLLLAEADEARGTSFEAVGLLAGSGTILAGRALNRAVWRLGWFARGRFDDLDRRGWRQSLESYHAAIDFFHDCVRQELDIRGPYLHRETEPSPLIAYAAQRGSSTNSGRVS
jgi:hypothetical protein